MRGQGRPIFARTVALAAAACGLGACATRPPAAPVDNSLDRLLADANESPSINAPQTPSGPRSALEDRMDATVSALERALAAEPPAAGGDSPAQPPRQYSGATAPATAQQPADDGGASRTQTESATSEPVALSELPPERLAAALAERLWAEAPDAPDPWAHAVTLTFLENNFDLPSPQTAGLGGPALELYRRLTPGQRESLSAMRHLAHETLRGEARSGETGPVGDVFDSLVYSLWNRDPVRISRVALCAEVRRYGDYDALASSRFLAGQTAEMVVYVELDRFTNVADGGGWKVDLSLEINVFSESGRTLVWRMRETPYPMNSSRRLRDVFLPAIVELPPTLGAGRYTLKAIVRDRSDGSVDERIVPITLVAE